MIPNNLGTFHIKLTFSHHCPCQTAWNDVTSRTEKEGKKERKKIEIKVERKKRKKVNTKKNDATIAHGLHHKTTWFLFQSSAWFHASLNSSILSPRVGSSSTIQHGIMWQVSKPAPRFGTSTEISKHDHHVILWHCKHYFKNLVLDDPL